MQTIKTKYIPATNTRGERIKAQIESGESITIPYDYALDVKEAHIQAIKALKTKMKWDKPMVVGGITGGYVAVFCNDTVIEQDKIK